MEILFYTTKYVGELRMQWTKKDAYLYSQLESALLKSCKAHLGTRAPPLVITEYLGLSN